MKSSKFRTCLGVLLILFAQDSVAFAQASTLPVAPTAPAAQDNAKNADTLFREGREAYNQRAFGRALELFDQSHKLEPGRGKLINIALCEKELGRFATSSKHFKEALAQLEESDSRRAFVEQNIAIMEPQIPRLRLVLSSSTPPHTVVILDGNEISSVALKEEILCDPGDHQIILRAVGLGDRRYDVPVAAWARMTLELEPGERRVRPVQPLKPEEPVPMTHNQRIGAIATGAVGLVGLAASVAMGVVALADHASAEEQCPTHHGCSQYVVDRAARGERLSIASTVAFAVTATGAGVSLYLLLSKTSSTPAQVGMFMRPDGGQFMIRSAF